eukprot:1526010-Prymnesium_polylepis.1
MADEKWSSEEKGNLLAFEARDNSPVPAKVRFKEQDAETRTQLVKLMFMPCVAATKPIGCYELDYKTWIKANDAKTKAGKAAKGITAEYLAQFLPKIAKSAQEAREGADHVPARQGAGVPVAHQGQDALWLRCHRDRSWKGSRHVASRCVHLPVAGEGGGAVGCADAG